MTIFAIVALVAMLAFLVGGFLAVTGLWARTFALGAELFAATCRRR